MSVRDLGRVISPTHGRVLSCPASSNFVVSSREQVCSLSLREHAWPHLFTEIRDCHCFKVGILYACPNLSSQMRATPLVRGKARFTVKNAVCCKWKTRTYDVFDCDFHFCSHKWSCSHRSCEADRIPCYQGTICMSNRSCVFTIPFLMRTTCSLLGILQSSPFIRG